MSNIQNERLRMYFEAEKAVLVNQSYTMNGKNYTRADLATIRAGIDDLLEKGAALDDNAVPVRIRRSKRIVFGD